MVNYRQTVFVIFIIVIEFSTGSWATEWKKIGESEGITEYIKPSTESEFQSLRAKGGVNAPVAVIEAILRDAPAYTVFVLNCTEYSVADIPGFENKTDSFHGYLIMDMPFPVKDRDAVCRTDFTINNSTGTIYAQINGIDTEYRLDKRKVRMPLVKENYILVPSNSNQTEVTFTCIVSPGGAIPVFISDMFSKNMGIYVIKGLRKMAQKEKYKNIRKVVTTTQH